MRGYKTLLTWYILVPGMIILILYQKDSAVGNIQIDSAQYGVYSGITALLDPVCDAKERFASSCNGKEQCEIFADAQLCSLPKVPATPGKLLIIKYHCTPRDTVPRGLRVLSVNPGTRKCLRCTDTQEPLIACP
jgi:hypothetical protein